MLAPGRRGLVFGVGREPLVSLFAGLGCEIVATDLDFEQAKRAGWVDANQHAPGLDALNEFGLCDPALFRERVSFRAVDMNAIPDDLREFDFIWSSCSLEHIGSIEMASRFVRNGMRCLRLGGVAVHTTEFNVSSNKNTIDNNTFIVLFRKRDIKRMMHQLVADGHQISVDFSLGKMMADRHVDLPPYCEAPHLRLMLEGFVTTSIGLIIQKDSSPRQVGRRGSKLCSWIRKLVGQPRQIAPAFSSQGPQ